MNHNLKILLLSISIVLLIIGCTKQEKVERFMEEGVEVIVNHLEPYKIKGESSTLHLAEEFTIDTEKDEIAESGLTDIGGFDIDSEENIYIFPDQRSDENLVYKFDRDGNFIKSFGKRGQGPSEILGRWHMYITDKDEIPILGTNPHKLVIFDKEGAFLHETRLKAEEYFTGFVFFPLENGNYLKFGGSSDYSTMHIFEVLQLLNSNFVEIKELDRCDYGIPFYRAQEKTKVSPQVFIWQISSEKIYVGYEKRGYEILIYDWDGNLLKKIRKEYTPADVPSGFKESYSNMGRYKDIVVLPDDMSPFHYFFLDDGGRLYVKTFEKGLSNNEYFHDIFNSEGIFISRKSMPGYARWRNPGNSVNRAKAKNHRFFCIREKESGYKELVVYKMLWE